MCFSLNEPREKSKKIWRLKKKKYDDTLMCQCYNQKRNRNPYFFIISWPKRSHDDIDIVLLLIQKSKLKIEIISNEWQNTKWWQWFDEIINGERRRLQMSYNFDFDNVVALAANCQEGCTAWPLPFVWSGAGYRQCIELPFPGSNT